jgi:hypothetical protein
LHYLCTIKRKYDTNMEAKDRTRQNPIRRLLEYKRAMRECIQRGADHEEMKKITKDYGFTLATPV